MGDWDWRLWSLHCAAAPLVAQITNARRDLKHGTPSWALGTTLRPRPNSPNCRTHQKGSLHLAHWSRGYPKALPGGFENEWSRVILDPCCKEKPKGVITFRSRGFGKKEAIKGKWALSHKVALR